MSPADHPCPTCGTPVSGGGKGRCRPCLNVEGATRNARLLAAELEGEWARDQWMAFVDETTITHSGENDLSSLVSDSLPFFVEIARLFPEKRNLDGPTFMNRVDSRLMRKHLLASSFMRRQLAVGRIGRELLDDAIERRRLKETLDESSGMNFAVLSGYGNALAVSKITLRTRRQYVRAATDFLASFRFDGGAWDSNVVLRYLKGRPGQGASLSVFIDHCRTILKLEVAMPPREQYRRSDEEKLSLTVKKLKDALRTSDSLPVHRLPGKTVGKILSLSLGVPVSHLLTARTASSKLEDGSISIFTDISIDASHRLYPYALRWLQLASGDAKRKTKSIFRD